MNGRTADMPSLTGEPGLSSLHFLRCSAMKRLYALGGRLALGFAVNETILVNNEEKVDQTRTLFIGLGVGLLCRRSGCSLC